MELPTITMERDAARKAVAEYHRAVKHPRHAEVEQEDRELLRAYKAVLKGATLIRLSDAIRNGRTITKRCPRSLRSNAATIDVELPRLAVARADVPFVHTTGITNDGGVRFEYEQRASATHEVRKRFTFGTGTFDEAERRRPWQPRMRALVPSIPPALRPPHALHNYHVLWEAEWEIDRTVPPGDPALLKHIGGDLYAVLAVWDLAPVEQAVLAGRRPTD